jgi:hypothetical protein
MIIHRPLQTRQLPEGLLTLWYSKVHPEDGSPAYLEGYSTTLTTPDEQVEEYLYEGASLGDAIRCFNAQIA